MAEAFVAVLVNLPSNRAIQLVFQGDTPGIIINRDLVNAVLFGTDSAFNPTFGGSIIDPLTFITYDGTEDLFAIASVGFIQVDVQPNSTNWAPSPSQTAASINALGLAKDTSVNAPGYGPSTLVQQVTQQTAIPNNIAATGVPLLNLKNALQNVSGQAITAGSTFTPAAITGITQPSYNLHITATSGASSTKPWYTVQLKWIDTATSLVVQLDTYSAFMSSTSNVLTSVIQGPTDADQLQITVTNNDTVTMTVNQLFIFMSSRPNYTIDYIYQFWTTAAMPAIATFQNSNFTNVPTGKILFTTNRTLAIGATTTPDYALPVYSGNVAIGFNGTGSNQWDIVITDQLTTTIQYRSTFTASNNSYAEWIFPRAPLTLHMTNNGSVLGSLNIEIVAI